MGAVLVIAPDGAQELRAVLGEAGFEVRVASSLEGALELLQKEQVEHVLLDVRLCPSAEAQARQWLRHLRQASGAPVLGLLEKNALADFEPSLPFDDLLVYPWRPGEVSLRLRRARWRQGGADNANLVRCADLAIDLERYQVWLAGEPVSLTFKEFELLRFLATNQGRVFTREALLNKVWGYEYYGGLRTVDVHIRRLRSKIELRGRTFVETVRNVGYRFVENP